ncbi:hypothetical protein [Streptomyces xantholiticus]|uniref:Uncharacterized protein n=1 Tax=Streptomyces xantholiticus TaxID=68285 RepID=A0ABV1UUI1_9ACTN|nr:hypothetical protein CGZ69_28890 [Streptomyces peucetius subsp. caesius ATCC 27952]
MRTLLVDNHDSFRLQPLPPHAEVNGDEPEVVRNDDPARAHRRRADSRDRPSGRGIAFQPVNGFCISGISPSLY